MGEYGRVEAVSKMSPAKKTMPKSHSPAKMSDRDIALWENDVSNLMGDEAFRQSVRNGTFDYLRRQGLTPAQAYPHEESAKQREEYARWLEQAGSNGMAKGQS